MSRLAAVLQVGTADPARVRATIESFHAHNPEEWPLLTIEDAAETAWIDLADRNDHENFVALVPGLRFLQGLKSSDFLSLSGHAFSFVTEAAEQAVDVRHRTAQRTRTEQARAMLDTLGVADRRSLRSGGLPVFSRSVLSSFRTDFLEPRGWSSGDALAVCGRAADWHWGWRLASDPESFVMREPLVRAFSSEADLRTCALHGISLTDLARGYVAVLDEGVGLPPETGEGGGLATVGFSVLAKAEALGVYSRMPRVKAAVERISRGVGR